MAPRVRFTIHIFVCKFLSQIEDADTRDHWFKSKRGRATACRKLGIDIYIVRSIRQQHEEPSLTVLANTLSAIVGAVWLDLQKRNESISATLDQIFQVLRQMDTHIADMTGGRLAATSERRLLAAEENQGVQGNPSEEAQNFTTLNNISDQIINLPDTLVLQLFDQNQDNALLGVESASSVYDSMHPQINLAPFGETLGIVPDSNVSWFH
jgi:hypothetical protein